MMGGMDSFKCYTSDPTIICIFLSRHSEYGSAIQELGCNFGKFQTTGKRIVMCASFLVKDAGEASDRSLLTVLIEGHL